MTVDADCSAVRLVGSSLSNEGIIEVFYNGSWGNVCDEFFDYKGAAVVCNSLGFGLVFVSCRFTGTVGLVYQNAEKFRLFMYVQAH